MSKIISVLFAAITLVLGLNLRAQSEPQIGMTKSDLTRLFSKYIEPNSYAENKIVTLKMPFWGQHAYVHVGFAGTDKIELIMVSFTALMAKDDSSNRLLLFQTIQRKVEALAGERYALARINGIDLLAITGSLATNLFAYGTTVNGITYGLEIVSDEIDKMAQTGQVRLTITKELPLSEDGTPPASPKPLVEMGDVIEIPSTPSRIGPQPPPAHRMKIAIGDQLISNDTHSAIVSLPPDLVGAEWIQMPKYPWNFYATFKLTAEADAYFAFSKDLKPDTIPSHWIATGEKIKTAIESYDLYRASLPVNTPILLCNGFLDEGSGLNPSIIIFKLRPAQKKGAG